MKTWPTTLFLCVSGLLLLGIGSAILLASATFHASNGIVLTDDPSLLSEIRAPGALLTACALLILAGAFRRSRRPLAVLLTALVYGSFGLARLPGTALDGTPSTGIVAATLIELIVAAVGLWIMGRQLGAEATMPLPTSRRHPPPDNASHWTASPANVLTGLAALRNSNHANSLASAS
jgi:hypothetical protein